MTTLQAGKIIEGYKLLSHLNSGAVAEIWKVEHLESKKTYAMKVVAAHTGLDNESLGQMQTNFLEVQQADHPNLLPIISFGEFDQRSYAILPLCHGDLSQEIRTRSLEIIKESGFSANIRPIFTEGEIAIILRDISSALAYVHGDMRKVHLDVKPSNILFSGEENDLSYLLGDFDIADDIKDEVIRRTRLKKKSKEEFNGETVAGSAPYMGPEQNEATYESTPASDIFALGVSLYELATGKLPSGKTLGKDIFHYGDKAVIPDLPATHFTSGLNQLMKSCLLPEPKDRPTAAFLKSNAQFFLQQGTWPTAPPTPSGRLQVEGPSVEPARLPQPKPRKSALGYLAAALLLAGVAYGGASLYQQNQLSGVEALLKQDGIGKIDDAIDLLNNADIIGLPKDQEKLKNELALIKNNLLANTTELKGLTVNSTMNFQDKGSGKWGTYQMYCGQIIAPRFEDMTSFNYDYAAFIRGDTVGFVGLTGEEVIFPEGKDPIVQSDRSAYVNGDLVDLPALPSTINCPTK